MNNSRVTIPQAMLIAVQHHQAGRLDEAEAIYRQILQVMPTHPHALHNLGEIKYRQRQYDLSLDLVNRAIQLDPHNAAFQNTLAATLFATGRVEDSEQTCRRVLQLNPNFPAAHVNLGNALVAIGEIGSALTEFERAIALDPDCAIAHDGRGLTLLLVGRLQEGWREQEWRWRKEGFDPRRFADRPQWDGSDLTSKTILIQIEQGYGDYFQFCRYVPLLAARGAKVVLEIVADVDAIMTSLAGVSEYVIAGAIPPPFDVTSPLLSVPMWYGTTLESIPANVPYLSSDPVRKQKWAEYFKANTNLKVGLVWAGRPTHLNDHNRSIPLRLLAPLAHVPDVTFYSLQKGDAAKQAANPPAGMKLVDLSNDLTDFNETAAVIAGLDLVIAVDTAVVHLAAAMGKPVWTLLPYIPDWRWLIDRDDSPWYPTMRLFRQEKVGDWEGVIAQVVDSLVSFRPLVIWI